MILCCLCQWRVAGDMSVNALMHLLLLLLLLLLLFNAGYFSRNSNSTTKWTTEESAYDFQKTKVVSTTNLPATLWPMPPSIRWVGVGGGDCHTREGQTDRGVNLTKHLALFTGFKNAWSYSFIPPLYLFRFMYCIVTTRNGDYFVQSLFLYFGK